MMMKQRLFHLMMLYLHSSRAWLCSAQKLHRKYGSSRSRRRSPVHTCIWISCTLLSHIMSCFKEVHRSCISSWCHFSITPWPLRVGSWFSSSWSFLHYVVLNNSQMWSKKILNWNISSRFGMCDLGDPQHNFTSTWRQCDCCVCEPLTDLKLLC